MYETTKRMYAADYEMEAPSMELSSSRLSISLIMMSAAAAGLWGATCIVSGLMQAGANEISRGLLTALIGI